MIWEDAVDLEDGTRVYVRVVRPSDRPTFEAGWERLSETSRVFRFLGPRRALRDEEYRYLTEFDGVDHLAIGVVTRDADGREGPVGAARFVRLADDRRAAELSITVVDEFQGRGVGRLLLGRLLVAARKRGIETLYADVLPENASAQHLILRMVPAATSQRRGDIVRLTIPLTEDA